MLRKIYKLLKVYSYISLYTITKKIIFKKIDFYNNHLLFTLLSIFNIIYKIKNN